MFDWVRNFQLFLFDFDGVLVNTEVLHFKAYQLMCERRGFKLPWDFSRYCLAAHYTSEGLEQQIYEELPLLKKREANWKILYQEKRAAYEELLLKEDIGLMPGVELLLKKLEEEQLKRCVVTHSPLHHIKILRERYPILNSIGNWVTRDDYIKAKPDPECYKLAIERLASENDRIIGFEDTPRGLKALQQTRALAMFICPSDYPGLKELLNARTYHSPSLMAIRLPK